MTSLTNITNSTQIKTSPREDKSPRLLSTQNNPTAGIGDENSSISSASEPNFRLRSSNESPRANSNEKIFQIDSSSLNRSNTTSTGKSKSLPDEPEQPRNSSYSDLTIPMMISTIFQRFLVRMPHTFIAMAGVFIPLYYALEKESLAISATTFVGVGGTVYCFVRAFFLETIPEWMLARNADTRVWRRLMNVTYTVFITMMFTTAVWKLPDLSAAQGLGLLTLSFAAPYPFLAKYYPDIDKPPSAFERKFGYKI